MPSHDIPQPSPLEKEFRDALDRMMQSLGATSVRCIFIMDYGLGEIVYEADRDPPEDE